MIAKSLVLLAVAIGLASAGTVRHNVHDNDKDVEDIDYYNCKGVAEGNYYHPSDCTKFITCSNDRAFERDCAACNPGDPRCPNGRTHFDEAADACLWPDESQCSGGPPDSECDPDCNEEGDCQSFRRCEKNGSGGGKWVELQCGDNLWWNGDKDSEAAVHGGQCVKWGDLTEELRQKYLNDETCIRSTTTPTTTTTTKTPECDWFEVGACSDGYVYNHPDRTEGRNVTLTCPGGLLWSQADKTCANCWEVNNGEEPCCPAPEVPADDETKEKYTCIKDGIYKNERDCRTFWKCLNGEPAKISCPDSEIFNPILLVCEPEELSGHFCAIKL